MKQKNVNKTIVATQVALLLGSSFSLTAMANDIDQVAKQPTASKVTNAESKSQQDVEVIQVTGIRGSLRDNLNNKRFSDAVVDSINTEDIAKNPDRNMAEALQRVPGVQISNEFGEGSQVSIRGTAPQFTNTLLNGQSLESSASLPLREETSAFDFSSMSADQISKIEVFKSPQANLPAGGIGGTVILHTKKPLEREDNSGFLKAEANYNDAYEKTSPQLSGLYNWINEDENFGTSFNLSYQEVNTQRDGNEALGGWYGYYRNDKPNQIANSIDDTPAYSLNADSYEKPGAHWGIPNSARFFREKKRLNGTVAFQYQPTDELNLNLDYTYNYNDNSNENHSLYMRNYYLARWAYVNQAPGFEVDREQDLLLHAQGNVNDIYDVNGSTTPLSNLMQMEFQDRDGSDASNDQLNLTADYQFDDVFVKFQVGRSTSESFVSDFGTQYSLNFQEGADTSLNDVGVYYDYDAASNTPSWGVTGGEDNWLAAPTSQMYLTSFFKREQFRENNENYFQGDLEWQLDNDYVSSIESGFKIRKKESNNHRYLANSSRADDQRITAGEMAGGTIDGVRDSVGTFPQSFFDIDKGLRDDIWANDHLLVNDLDDCTVALNQSSNGERGCRTGFQEEFGQFYDQQSDINEACVMANISAGKLRGNVGVRFVDTDRTSLTYQTVGEDGNGDAVWQTVTTNSDSQDVLPSINLSYDLTNELVVRTAASKVIDHPTLAQVRDSYSITGNYDSNGDIIADQDAQRVGSIGNPDLASYEANQFEVGFEWYFTEASLFGVTAFYKDLKNIIRSQSFIQDLTGDDYYTTDGQLAEGEYAITSNYNVGEQQINGYEVQLQHDFGNGFGVQGNYTFINVPDEEFTSQDYTAITEQNEEGETIVTGYETDDFYTQNVRSEGNSKHTGNAQVYYENETFSARLAYNYRSQYFDGPSSQSDLVVDDKQTVDMKMTYQISENVMSTFSITNLFDEEQEYYFIRQQIEAPAGGIPEGQEVYYTQRKEKVAGSHYTTGRNVYLGLNWTF